MTIHAYKTNHGVGSEDAIEVNTTDEQPAAAITMLIDDAKLGLGRQSARSQVEMALQTIARRISNRGPGL